MAKKTVKKKSPQVEPIIDKREFTDAEIEKQAEEITQLNEEASAPKVETVIAPVQSITNAKNAEDLTKAGPVVDLANSRGMVIARGVKKEEAQRRMRKDPSIKIITND